MGDFNAAQKEQTEKYIKGNENFLKKIKTKGYIELLDEKEKNGEIGHYTHYVKDKGRKLDHVFVSKAFAEYFETTIEYDDDVNYKKQNDKDSNNAFTDHSAIKVIIGKK